VLRRNPHQHPLLYLKGVKFSDLQSVLNFMYHGEVNVAQEELNSFLAVAEELRVKGLTQNQSQSQSSSSSKDQYPAPPLLAPAPRAVEAPPGKRPRPPAPPEDDEIQEVAPPAVKTEPVAQQSSVGEYGAGAGYGGALQQVEEAAYEEEGWEDYTDYSGYGGAAVEAAPGDKGLGSGRTVFDQYLQKTTTEGGKAGYSCTLCGKENSHMNNVRNHVESVHFPGHFSYNCPHCEKTFKSKNSISTHVSREHRDFK